MQYDLKPVEVHGVFTPEEYASVYQTINTVLNDELSKDKFNVSDTGYIAITRRLDRIVLERILYTAQKYTNLKLKNSMTHIARYTHMSQATPTLRPHYDIMLEQPSITISIQLDGTMDWDLFVENQKFSLFKNSAAIFSGSHQIHWRPPINFKENDYFDVMVCQLYSDEGISMILTDEHKELMKNKSNHWNVEYDKIYS